MNYFISRNGQEFGPYTLGDLQRYVASGNILVSDLTRSEAMTDWVPVSQVIGNIPVPLMGQAPPAEPLLRRDGKKFVVTQGGELPHHCVKCGQPVEGELWQKNFIWYNPWFNLLLLVGLIELVVVLIIYYTTRKQMKLAVPLCPKHRQKRRTILWAGAILLITSPWLLVLGAFKDSEAMLGGGVIVVLLMLLAGAIVLSQAPAIRPKKIDDREGVFAGAGEAFLQLIECSGGRAAGTGL